MTRALVFDLDGTLVDSMADIAAAVNRMLARIGQPEMGRDQIKSFVGNGAPTLVLRVLTVRDIPTDRHDELLSAFLTDYTARAAELTAPYPGVLQALDVLARRGHPMAVCTNKPAGAARSVLDALGLSPYLPVLVGGDSLPVTKPDPAPLLSAIAALGGGSALFVGDSEVDIDCGVNAGVSVALFTQGYLRDPAASARASHHFDRWTEFPALVAALP